MFISLTPTFNLCDQYGIVLILLHEMVINYLLDILSDNSKY